MSGDHDLYLHSLVAAIVVDVGGVRSVIVVVLAAKLARRSHVRAALVESDSTSQGGDQRKIYRTQYMSGPIQKWHRRLYTKIYTE
mgnify:CR=1 FL=1